MRNAERKLQRTPGEEEIAAELKISLAGEYQQWVVELRAISHSLEVVEDGEEMSVKFISDDEQESPERILERSGTGAVVAEG